MPGDHARLSPSGAARWLTCTAAPTLEAKYPEETSEYAKEGTFAHKIAELCAGYAVGNIPKAVYTRTLNKLKKNELYSQEMLDYCEEYATYIKEKYLAMKEECPDAFVELEVRLDLTRIIPEGFGTADCVIVAEPKLWICDFKYGKGVKVDAKGNQQMEIYALGAVDRYKQLYDIETVGMSIIQPRLGGVSEAEMLEGALQAWATTEIIPLAKEAYSGPGRFVPSEDACKFCKAKGDCKARAEYYVKFFEDNEDLTVLTNQQAGNLLQRVQGMKDWFNDLEAKVTATLFKGEAVEGWKLVEGKTNRKWVDEEVAEQILRDEGFTDEDLFKKKLIGIPDAEKKLGKKRAAEVLQNVIIKPEGKPTLAPESDNRPEIHPEEAIKKMFEED